MWHIVMSSVASVCVSVCLANNFSPLAFYTIWQKINKINKIIIAYNNNNNNNNDAHASGLLRERDGSLMQAVQQLNRRLVGRQPNMIFWHRQVASFHRSQQRHLAHWISHRSLSCRSGAARWRLFKETTESPAFFSSAFRSLFSTLTRSCSTTVSLATRSDHFSFSFTFYRAAWNADAVLRWEFCLPVCPSVCHTCALWQNGRKICPDFYTIRKII